MVFKLKLILDVPNKQIDIVRISDEVQYTISTCTWGNPPQLAPHHNRPNRTHQGLKLLSLTFFKQALLFFFSITVDGYAMQEK